MKTRFLFVFGYESPAERSSNETSGTDFESSSAVWIRADSEEQALRKGCEYADQYVRRQYEQAGISDSRSWIHDGFAHWIARRPHEEFSEADLKTFDEI